MKGEPYRHERRDMKKRQHRITAEISSVFVATQLKKELFSMVSILQSLVRMADLPRSSFIINNAVRELRVALDEDTRELSNEVFQNVLEDLDFKASDAEAQSNV